MMRERMLCLSYFRETPFSYYLTRDKPVTICKSWIASTQLKQLNHRFQSLLWFLSVLTIISHEYVRNIIALKCKASIFFLSLQTIRIVSYKFVFLAFICVMFKLSIFCLSNRWLLRNTNMANGTPSGTCGQ